MIVRNTYGIGSEIERDIKEPSLLTLPLTFSDSHRAPSALVEANSCCPLRDREVVKRLDRHSRAAPVQRIGLRSL